MRKAEIEIRWEGPDKPVREFIENGLDNLFYELSTAMGEKILFLDASTSFTARIKASGREGLSE